MSVFDYKEPRAEPKPYKVPRCPCAAKKQILCRQVDNATRKDR